MKPAAAEILRRLVAHDSTSANSTDGIVHEIANLLDRPGIRLRVLPAPQAGKANLLAELGPPTDPVERDGLLLSGHMDVVPAMELGWLSDPFSLTDVGDRWRARGSCDMKGFLALAIHRATATDSSRLRAPLTILFTYDEEVGTLGAQDFVCRFGATVPLPKAAIIGEPTSLKVVRLHKGHLKLRVTLHGVSAHSSQPHLGKNAVEAAGRALLALAQLRREFESEHPPGSEHFPEAPFVTLNAGMIRGGVAVNVIPERCELSLGLRSLPGMASDDLRARVTAAVEAAVPQATPTVEVLGDSPPMSCPENAAACQALRELVGDIATHGVSFASDAGPLQALGVEAVLFGPGSIADAHRANEFLPKDEFVRAGDILDALVRRCCAAPGEEAS
jgi:acetylornithine deacetylase